MGDLDWLRAKENENQCWQRQALEQARAEAERNGKEPFDFGKLCALFDASSELGYQIQNAERTAAALERRYYLDCPEVNTLAGFAARLDAERPWR